MLARLFFQTSRVEIFITVALVIGRDTRTQKNALRIRLHRSDIMDCGAEYLQIFNEYAEPSGKFFKAIELTSDQNGHDQLSLTLLDDNETHNNVKVNVQVCESGWFKAHSSAEVEFFPTFEAIACQISPEFKLAWWKALDAAVDSANSPLLSTRG